MKPLQVLRTTPPAPTRRVPLQDKRAPPQANDEMKITSLIPGRIAARIWYIDPSIRCGRHTGQKANFKEQRAGTGSEGFALNRPGEHTSFARFTSWHCLIVQ
ncbi:hypothetical protein CIHG_09424 [Coccidioides immitis H538.4]|uniref:Uncharacterized protein n=2 Tax=Coccidioides immitis TaxID=5501 RepID=A0A0J8TJ87_COCIT|nr:hypothetical protein CISG_10172 [Coccidioides immitis RMSCC 3703]KMU91665.1 hypothetical protein CIHG_09424 [Coccidioides immitis H538.4]